MGTKNNPGKFDVYEKAHPDEPMFVLLARDPDAPTLVDLWAHMRAIRSFSSGDLAKAREKIYEAQQCANAMRAYKARNTYDTTNPIGKPVAPMMKSQAELEAEAAQRQREKALEARLAAVHAKYIGHGLDWRLYQMRLQLMEEPQDLWLAGAVIMAKLAAHGAWVDGENYGRKIHEGLTKRVTELLDSNKKYIDEKRKMCEAPTSPEIMAAAHILMAKTDGKGFTRTNDQRAAHPKDLPTYYAMNVAAEVLREFVKSRMRAKPEPTAAEETVDVQTAANVETAQQDHQLAKFYAGEPKKFHTINTVGVLWDGSRRYGAFFNSQVRFMIERVPVKVAVEAFAQVFGPDVCIDDVRNSTHLWTDFFNLVKVWRRVYYKPDQIEEGED